ncbi:hypothetical protein [Leptospira meyeri]|uniref:hypothetical protein n=1 Tax=Leptospira meyeri TaxID=29508 RepID=UPI0002BFE3F2|nr:hypothetical protein [Leptospira meyeri]EMJ90313.1 hypothetical protein LEP1GSC196_0219 [Leptospira meyeri serovar Semaranga str. Veldrot Semarang 173]
MNLHIKSIKLLFFIYLYIFITNCGNTRFTSIDQIKIYKKPNFYNSKNQVFELTFSCDQWYYNYHLYEGYKIDEDDCANLIDHKIEIIGEVENTYIGHISNDLFLFADLNNVNERLKSDKTIYKFCKRVIYTRSNSFNYKNANLFLKSTQNPEESVDSCFELHKDLHFMKPLFKINKNEYIFNIRSTLVFLTFYDEYKMEKNTRFILKVIGWKKHSDNEEIRKYPHYQAFQIE